MVDVFERYKINVGRQHFTLSHIFPKHRVQFTGHASHAKVKVISDLLWKASTGRKFTFPDTISRDSHTGIKVEDFPDATANKTVWYQIVCNILARATR